MGTKELISKLREIESKSGGHDCVFRTHILDLCKSIGLRDRAIERMRAALKFYSDECGGPYAPGDHHSVDGGLTATEALAECDRLLVGETL